MVASAIQAALSAIDHLTANTVTATNAKLTNATVTTLHVTGTATLDTPLSASSGGTGISTAPTYGQLLMGQSNGTYALVSTSSLGIPGGTGAWGAITGTISNQSDLQNALNAKLSLAQWYAHLVCRHAYCPSQSRERRHHYGRHVERGRHRNKLRRHRSYQCPKRRSTAARPVKWNLCAGINLLARHHRRRRLRYRRRQAPKASLLSTTPAARPHGDVSLFLAQNGNVGIGTSSPFTTLAVNGSGYFTGSLTAAASNFTNLAVSGSYQLNGARGCADAASFNTLLSSGSTVTVDPWSCYTLDQDVTIANKTLVLNGVINGTGRILLSGNASIVGVGTLSGNAGITISDPGNYSIKGVQFRDITSVAAV